MRTGLVYFNNILCGKIWEDDNFYFQYDAEYLKNESPNPVSLTLPLSDIVYESNILFPFFDGLIPEGWLLDVAIDKWKLNKNDRMSLLLCVCEDTIGAVSVKEEK